MDKFQYYDMIKNRLEISGIRVHNYKEINYGLQFNIELNNESHIVRVFESKKNGVRSDLSLIKDTKVADAITNAIGVIKSTANEGKTFTKGDIDLPKSFSIADATILEKIKLYLSGIGARKEKPDIGHKDEVYSIDNVKLTIFNSGKVLMQGKTSKKSDELYNEILLIIKKKQESEFKENIQEYFADSQDYSNFFEVVEDKENICNKGEEFLGKDLFHYLNINDQITLLDAIELYYFAKDKKIKFKNYAIIIRNFAIAFEGFLIKIFIDSNIISEEEYEQDVRTALGNKLGNKMIMEFIKNPARNEEVAISLEYVWKSHRNKNLHSDFIMPKLIDTFEEAEQDVNEVKKTIIKCYELLDFDKMYINKFANCNGSESYEINGIQVEKALAKLVGEGFSIKQQKKACWSAQKENTVIVNINNVALKVIGPKRQIENYKNYFDEFRTGVQTGQADIEENAIIGTDESGKGDYYGPLVIAGVYADENMKKKLKELGVDDSKKLSDSHISLLASKIKEICKFYNVVVIGNQKYNELYSKLGNLNKLLAWGHARVIENILSRTECNIALSDQFGNPQLIKNALMNKGKNIHLEQRPKAEQNVVVAAASILARNEFVERIKDLSEKYNLEFTKGVSNKTIEVGKAFVKQCGKENLSDVAKLHFKTTSEI